MIKAGKLKYLVFFACIVGFVFSTSTKMSAQDNLKKQLKKQEKVAGNKDETHKTHDSKYDKIESDNKRKKYLKESTKKGKVKISNQPTQFEVKSAAPPAKNPQKTRAEAAQKNKSVGKVRDIPDGESRNSTEFKASSGGPPPVNKSKNRAEAERKNHSVGKVRDIPDGESRNSTEFKASSGGPPPVNKSKNRAEAERKNHTVGKVRDIPDGESRNSTEFKASSGGPPPVNKSKNRAEAERKNHTVGKVRDIPDGESRNSTEFKASSGGPPPVDRAKNRAEAERKSKNVGKVRDIPDGESRNSTEFKASSGGPPPVDRAKNRAEAERKNRNVGKVRDIPDGESRNSTEFKASSGGPPPVDRAKNRAEAERKNKNVGKVRDIPDGESRNSTEFKASSGGPPPVDRAKIRAEAEKKNNTVGAVKDYKDDDHRNPTEFKTMSAAPPAKNPQKTREEAAKKNETIGQSTKMANYTENNKNSNMRAKKNVGMVEYLSESETRNPTVFKSTANERINAPSPKARKEALLVEMEQNSGDIKQSTRNAWLSKRNYNSTQASHYEGSVSMGDVKKMAKNKEELKDNMEQNSGDIKQSTRDAWLAKRNYNSTQASHYEGSVKQSTVNKMNDDKEDLRKDMEKFGSGDISAKTREQQYDIRKQKSEEMANFTPIKKSVIEKRNEQKEQLKEDMEKYATGDISLKTRENQYAIRKEKSEEMANYTGAVKMSVVEARNKKREELKKDMEKYGTGDISLKTRENQYAIRKQKSEETANYTGSVKMSVMEARAEKKEALRKEMSKYSTGDIKLSDLEKRDQARRVKSREMASYSGTFKVKDIKKQQKKVRQNASDMANYQGNIKIQRRVKGVHPSVMYRQGWNNDRKTRDKLRRKMLKKSRRKGDLEKPNYLKNNLPKPGYDPREAEIWYK